VVMLAVGGMSGPLRTAAAASRAVRVVLSSVRSPSRPAVGISVALLRRSLGALWMAAQ
jgi:hypothetical protein